MRRILLMLIALCITFTIPVSANDGTHQCRKKQVVSKVDPNVIFYYNGTHEDSICVGPAFPKYPYSLYGRNFFDFNEFMQTVPEGQGIILAVAERGGKDGQEYLRVTMLVVGREKEDVVRGWNFIMNAEEDSGETKSHYSMDVKNDTEIQMIPKEKHQYFLLAEIDSSILRFHGLPELIRKNILEPYMQYLLGQGEGKEV
jgi:hypothetical protein